MQDKIRKHFDSILSHLYINPLERCNLHCKICYTRKTSPILSENEILEFVGRYRKTHKLETITFCGGEGFTLPYFPKLINKLVKGVRFSDSATRARHGIFIQIITNGTIDKLSEFDDPNMVNLIVSIDGLPNYHDDNRGLGNFQKSIGFLEKAHKLGFHTEIFSVVTRQNFHQIDKFEQYLFSLLNSKLRVTYHPRKPPYYLLHHPVSNVFGETDGFDFLTDSEIVKIMKERITFPSKELGCFQISLASDGKIFGCCEGTIPIGKMNDNIKYLSDKLKERLTIWENNNSVKNCLGCSQPDFVCGIKKYLVDLSSRT